jgi:methyl-accepting chemotaxis protein
MPLADSVTLQLDLAQTLGLVGSVVAGLTGAAVAFARVVVAYLARKDELQRAADALRDEQIERLGAAVAEQSQTHADSWEKNKAALESLSASWRAEGRETVNSLVGLTKEAVTAMTLVSTKVGGVESGQDELKGEVRQLGENMTELSHSIDGLGKNVERQGEVIGRLGESVGHLTERVDVIDGRRPPASGKPKGGPP